MTQRGEQSLTPLRIRWTKADAALDHAAARAVIKVLLKAQERRLVFCSGLG